MNSFTVAPAAAGRVLLVGSPRAQTSTTEQKPKTGPNPLTPELKEILWGILPFVVFAVLMRFVLFPRLKKGMDARYGKIQGDLADADATRASAHKELADYHAALAGVRAEAGQRLDAARAQLDRERTARLAEVNAAINERKAQAAAEVEAARLGASRQVADAVASVATNATRKLLGREPKAAVVRSAVDEVMSVGVAR
jgi:F-type H+-transporting ATPase subunit b